MRFSVQVLLIPTRYRLNVATDIIASSCRLLLLSDFLLYWQQCISGVPSTAQSCAVHRRTSPHVS